MADILYYVQTFKIFFSIKKTSPQNVSNDPDGSFDTGLKSISFTIFITIITVLVN